MRTIARVAAASLLATAVTAATAAPPLPAGSSAAETAIGLSIGTWEGLTEKGLGADLIGARAMGIGVMYSSYSWAELEPQPGDYRLKPIEDILAIYTSLGFDCALTLKTIDSGNRRLPHDLMGKPFDSPEVRERFERLLEAVSAKLTKAVRWVMLANEADSYLARHPNELEAFAGLVERGREQLRLRRPGL